MVEELLLSKAAEKINALHGFDCHILSREAVASRRRADARILVRKGHYQQEFHAEVKTKIVPAQTPRLKTRMQGLTPYIMVAEYITPQAREILRKEQIAYLDTAGNFYLDDEGIYILIETDKTNRSSLPEGANKAFNKAGLKVIYQFLIHPEYLNKPYRFIAERATVTIDTVRRVIQGLLAQRYIIQVQRKVYQFTDRPKLFEEWVTSFNKNLRPALKQNKYQWLDRNQNWQTVELPEDTCWGGAAAGEKLSDYLIADSAIVYTSLPFQELMKKLKIIPNPSGTITVMEQFWKDEESTQIAHPMLVYADLINDANPRYIETADKIYASYVTDKL